MSEPKQPRFRSVICFVFFLTYFSCRNTLTVIDNRTGKTIEIPISYSVYNESFIDSTEFKKLKTSDEDSGITFEVNYYFTAYY